MSQSNQAGRFVGCGRGQGSDSIGSRGGQHDGGRFGGRYHMSQANRVETKSHDDEDNFVFDIMRSNPIG